MRNVFFVSCLCLVLIASVNATVTETGEWLLDDASGTTAVDTYGNDGTVTSGTWGTDYLTFDGTDTRVDANNADWNGEYWCWDADTQFTVTWELDIRTTSTQNPTTGSNGDAVMLFSDTASTGHVRGNKVLVFTANGTLSAAGFGVVGVTGETTTLVNDGIWHHVKVIWEMDTASGATDTVRVFVDTVEELTLTGLDWTYPDTDPTKTGDIIDWIDPGMILGYNAHPTDASKWDPFEGDMKNVTVTYDDLVGIPTITTDPVSQTVAAGDPVTFTVAGNYLTSWQWYKVGDPDVALSNGGDISGADSNSLTITNVELADEGFYYCSCNSGVLASDKAVLITERLVGHWDFEGADDAAKLTDKTDGFVGNYVDDLDGAQTPVWGTSYSGLQNLGNAIDLGDDVNHVKILNSSEWFSFYTRGFTVSSWVKPTDLTSGNTNRNMVSMNDFSNKEGWIHRLRDEAVENRIYDGSGSVSLSTNTGSIAVDTWYNIMTVFEPGARMAIYVDGVLVKEDTTGIPASIPATAVPLTLGSDDLGANPFIGLLDEVKIWSYALDKWEIAQEYADVSGESICVESTLTYDISGPEGDPDCIVNLYDFAEFAAHWLEGDLVSPE